MKFCKIQDTLNRCSSFLDVACIALDNEHFFQREIQSVYSWKM